MNKKGNILESFNDLGVSEGLIKGLNDLNIHTPSKIQTAVIPLLINNKTDLVGQAPTGTGKTAAYGLPMLHVVDSDRKEVQGLILCPTRELGQQIAKQLFKFTKYTEKIFTEAVCGGAPIDRQISALKRPTHIVVATPGRLIDLVNRKALDLSHVHTVVLDEADEMLSMGFKKELDEILSFLSSERNTWLFSATMPSGIKEIVKTHMSEDAQRVQLSGKNVVNQKITHQFLACEEKDKLYELMQFIKSEGNNRGVVFCRTKVDAQRLSDQLILQHVAADTIHGDLRQRERDKVMRAFKNGRVRLLVATDIAARGLDIEGLSFVVHYQLPDKDEYYTHRSGRTARAGKEGVSLALVTEIEKKQLDYFERKLGISFKERG